MRLRFEDIHRHFKSELKPVYLVSGDEPLQQGEAADAIRAAARAAGYATREVYEADNKFDWGELSAAANSLSLFSDRRIIDLRVPGGAPGIPGGKALVEYAERPPEDTILLITLPKLDRRQQASQWFKALDRIGALVQVWPVDAGRLPQWINQRMQGRGLQPEPEAVRILAERVEGNLLAASQEIEKLLLIQGPGAVSAEQLTAAVADSARYDVFTLVDAALQGQIARALHILNGLRAEGTPEPVVLWALAREIRTLVSVAGELEKGASPQQAMAARRDIWDKRKPLVAKGAQRLPAPRWRALLVLCAQADRAIKGRKRVDPWLLFQDITAQMAGLGRLPAP